MPKIHKDSNYLQSVQKRTATYFTIYVIHTDDSKLTILKGSLRNEF